VLWDSPEERRAYHKRQYHRRKRENPEAFSRKRINRKLKNLYGITLEEKERMFRSQDKACAACKTAEVTDEKHWHVDHCHDTKKIRGILCHHCNVGIGFARDDINTLKSWISYLESNL
jgi:hypothetical protein